MPKYDFGFKDNPNVIARSGKHLGGDDPPISAVSFFAGCGGLDIGVKGGFQFLGADYPQLPIDIKKAYDIDQRAIETYKLNISEDAEVCDLVEVDHAKLPSAEILFGGFPCQDFSTSGPKTGLEGRRGRLYEVMIEYMNTHRPAVVVGENVPGLARLQGGAILETILRDLTATGYRFKVWSLYCPDYGLPQSRTRLILVGVRNDIEGFPVIPPPTHLMAHRSIDDAIGDLEAVSDEAVPNQSQYFVATAATAGGGQGDHVSKRGQLAYTVRANAKARIHFHYSLPRRLTVRECARLQSFPDEFVFPHSAMNAMTQIGNAVPPIIANSVGRSLVEFFRTIKSR